MKLLYAGWVAAFGCASMTIGFGGLLILSCTDAARSGLTAFGDPGKVTCYSGGKIIYEGKSTGKIHTESGSDGWYFRDESGNLIRVSGDCVIVN